MPPLNGIKKRLAVISLYLCSHSTIFGVDFHCDFKSCRFTVVGNALTRDNDTEKSWSACLVFLREFDHFTHEQVANPFRILSVGLISFLRFCIFWMSKKHRIIFLF